MRISLIAAMSQNGVIGRNNQLPWHLPEELKHFRTTTAGKPVLMGRKTFESIGKPLPGRHNIILTQDQNFSAAGCTVVHSLEAGLKAAGEVEELMIIGGAKVYELCLPIVSRLYLSIIQETVEGDTYFPKINWGDWEMISQQQNQEFTVKIWDRKSSHNTTTTNT